MQRSLSILVSFILAVTFLAGADQVRPKHPKAQTKPPAQPQAAQPQPQAVSETPAVQPPPRTPEHGPSSPPQVTFQGGQLTIEARNSTMGDVLNAVKQKTGAAVEMPITSSERVVGVFGPGAPRDVMAQLLNGSHYDYVLLGSPADPGALNKIVLMARALGPEPQPAQQTAVSRAYKRPGDMPSVPEVDAEQPPPDDNSEAPQEVQQPPEEEPPQPEQGQEQVAPPQPDQGQQPGQNGPVVKTPEQLLRELQQQQQQQQPQNAQPE